MQHSACHTLTELLYVDVGLETAAGMINHGACGTWLLTSTKAGDTRTRNWYQKLLPETCTKMRRVITVSCTKTTLQPITLHGSCHVPDSFCAGIASCVSLCSIYHCIPETCTRKKLVRHTCKFLVPDDCTSFCWCVCRWLNGRACASVVCVRLSVVFCEGSEGEERKEEEGREERGRRRMPLPSNS